AYGFKSVSILSTLTTYELDAENNWWGSADPTFVDLVSDNVDYTPWLLNPITEPNLDSFFYRTGEPVSVTIYYAPLLDTSSMRTEKVEIRVTSTTDTAGFLMD
ncbi:unnamed protein product, partial [marine sediment metagenome]